MTVGMSAPPMGMISSTPNTSARPAKMGKSQRLGRIDDEPHAERRGDAEQREVDEVLTAVGDGALGQHLLQFAHGHQAAGEGEKPQQRFEHERDHHERGQNLVELLAR